ncbi:hypothetical protein CXX84_03495 [Arthrobacter sp. AFG7.2]|uniref:polysaccharide biosynthesis protein n=1 Tax=Arthrobacter sp. AFG7.2 TaxID=1688693 RepID=UPI000C9E73D7|nr:hypothetical protein CXX84_03495 [Arthrobacter sp. AFG7.2]
MGISRGSLGLLCATARGVSGPAGFLRAVRVGRRISWMNSAPVSVGFRSTRITPVVVSVARFFTTIPEACRLVVQTRGSYRPGEVPILDMREPARTLDVGRRKIAGSGRAIMISVTGLRRGEEVHKVPVGLFESMDGQSIQRSVTPDCRLCPRSISCSTTGRGRMPRV